MFEVVGGIVAGLLAKHWSALIIFPCIIGLIAAVWLTFRQRISRIRLSRRLRLMRAEGISDTEVQETEEYIKFMAGLDRNGIALFGAQFVWSSLTALPFCLVVGGIKLIFFQTHARLFGLVAVAVLALPQVNSKNERWRDKR